MNIAINKYILILITILLIIFIVIVINKKNIVRYDITQKNITIVKSPIVYGRTNINRLIYDNPHYEKFYDKYTKNHEITTKIINYAIDNNIPINIAFSIVWNESRYKINAVGPKNSNGTRDWGLLQLNDGFRHRWTRKDFFDIDKNIKTGMEYLAYCISRTGSLEKGIGAYNKGIRGIHKYGLPKKYISDILTYEKKLDIALNNYIYN